MHPNTQNKTLDNQEGPLNNQLNGFNANQQPFEQSIMQNKPNELLLMNYTDNINNNNQLKIPIQNNQQKFSFQTTTPKMFTQPKTQFQQNFGFNPLQYPIQRQIPLPNFNQPINFQQPSLFRPPQNQNFQFFNPPHFNPQPAVNTNQFKKHEPFTLSQHFSPLPFNNQQFAPFKTATPSTPKFANSINQAPNGFGAPFFFNSMTNQFKVIPVNNCEVGVKNKFKF